MNQLLPLLCALQATRSTRDDEACCRYCRSTSLSVRQTYVYLQKQIIFFIRIFLKDSMYISSFY